MNLRPRCREWLPLATQQLRLRNLARIQGINIECGTDTSSEDQRTKVGELLVYYTLHTDKASEAFYTSEALPQRHQQQKWAEICSDDDVWRKSNAQCVCVKVWASYQAESKKHKPTETEEATTKLTTTEPQSALTHLLANADLTPNKLPRPPELLFSWGVYFSGLIPLAPLSLAKCRVNCLIFQLNGQHFTSPAMISAEGLQELIHDSYERYAASGPVNAHAAGINSPPVSRNSSPVPDQSERELLRLTSTRYTQLRCFGQEIRLSYGLQQLLELQHLQRLQLQKQRDSAEIRTDIARLSVPCITRNELRYKPRTTSLSSSPYGHTQYLNHSMGRKLSVLLAEQQQIEPLTLYNAQQLSRRIEALRCKRRLLQAERETFIERNACKQKLLNQLCESRVAMQEQLYTRRKKLEERQLELQVQVKQLSLEHENKRQITRQIERRMSTLIIELQEIYNLQSLSQQQLCICGIAFPYMEHYASDARQTANAQLLENVSPLAVSAALGYVAHLVQMLANIMDRPLRNPIIYEPSRTRIADNIKELTHYSSHDFPLYTRSILPSQQTKYAIYLLKQNVAQLCFDIAGYCDLRNTFGSLLELFKTLREIELSQRDSTIPISTTKQLDELDAPKGALLPPHINGLAAGVVNQQQLSQSQSSVDMNHVPIPTAAATTKETLLQSMPSGVSQALAIEGFASTQRICRSVGSCSDGDDDFRPMLEHTYSNSDSNIAFQIDRS